MAWKFCSHFSGQKQKKTSSEQIYISLMLNRFDKYSSNLLRHIVKNTELFCFSVGDKNMLNFIRDKTADPYFWNLVWFIGNHAIELDNCVLKESQ